MATDDNSDILQDPDENSFTFQVPSGL